MVFCCFRISNAARSSDDAVASKCTEQHHVAAQKGSSGRSNGAGNPQTGSNNTKEASTCGPTEATAPGASSQTKSQQPSQDAVMRVVALLQELLGLTSERMQVSRIMALLCQRLSLSWACLTALSADGEVFQHIGSAYLVDGKVGTCSFSSCRTNSGIAQTAGGLPSRTSSTNSIVGVSVVEIAMSDPHLLRGSDTSIEVATFSTQPLLVSEPLGPPPPPPPLSALAPSITSQSAPQAAAAMTGAVQQPSPQAPVSSTGTNGQTQGDGAGGGCALQHHQRPHPHPHPQHNSQPNPQNGRTGEVDLEAQPGSAVPVSEWPLDWQLMYREKGLRAFACFPVTATNGSGAIVGCLSFASSEPLDWSRQYWAPSTRLITGWAAGAITTTRATARASFYARLFGATGLDGLARAFAYDMPVFLADGAAGPGTALPEVRLALVSSRLQHAVVYAAPLLQVSGRLGLPPLGGGGGGGGAASAAVAGMGGGGLIVGGGSFAGGGSGASMAGLVLGSGLGLGLGMGPAEDRYVQVAPPGLQGRPSGGGGGGGGVIAVGGGAGGAFDTMDCMVLGAPADLEEQLSGGGAAAGGGGPGGGRSSSTNSTGGGGQAWRCNTSSATDGSRAASLHQQGEGRGRLGLDLPVEAPPVDCIKISTDNTLLMSVLEAGDIMIIKDALQYFGGGRMVARDLALNNTRPATAGTLVILPLVHRCRSLGCVYVFARNEFNLTFSRAAWSDLAGMLSRAVFSQLVGQLRHEWYSVLCEDLDSRSQYRSSRTSPAGGASRRGRVRRTTTGNSLCSNASSLRPSFELPSRSVEQQGGPGGPGGGAGGAGGSRDAAAAALAAAAAVLEYAGLMLPDGDDGPGGQLGPQSGPAPPPSMPSTTSPKSPALPTPPQSGPRHRIPPEHARVGTGGADGEGPAGSRDGPESGNEGAGGAGGGGFTTTITATTTATTTVAPTTTAGDTASVQGTTAAGETSSAAATVSLVDRCSPSPGSLSFKLPPDLSKFGDLPLAGPSSEGAAAGAAAASAAAAAAMSASASVSAVLPGSAGELGLSAAGACGGLTLTAGAPEAGAGADIPSPPLERVFSATVAPSGEVEVEAAGGRGGATAAVAATAAAAGSDAAGPAPSATLATATTLSAPQHQLSGASDGLMGCNGGGGGGGGGQGQVPSAAGPKPVKALQACGEGLAAGPPLSGQPEPEGEEGEEVSGSSRELQGWPELVDILFEMHRTRNVSVYLAAYRGQAVAIKMMRSHLSMDGRPGHLESEALTIAAQQQLSTVRHANVLRVLMVYPLVYEVVAGSKPQRHGTPGGPAGGASFHGHGGAGFGGPSSVSQAPAPQLSGLGLGPLHVQAQAHAMGDLLAGAGLADMTGGGVYLTAVLPRREKFKRGLALMLELFPSISLREAIQKRMLLSAAGADGGSPADGVLGGPGGVANGLPPHSQTIFSDAGCFVTSGGTAAPGPGSSGGGGGAGGIGPGVSIVGGLLVGGAGTASGTPFGQQQQQQQQQPHGPLSFLPTLPEVLGSNDPSPAFAFALANADSSPGLAMTGASNSGGANTGGFGSGPGGGGAGNGCAQAPPLPVLLSILSQIAAGMAALHSAGLAHGELRPENVMLAVPPGAPAPPSLLPSGHQDRATCGTMDGAPGATTPRASPTPTPRGGGGGGAASVPSGNSGRGRSSSWVLQSAGANGSVGVGGGGGSTGEPGDRSSKPERPQMGRPITADVIVKIKDAAMTVVGFSKGSQTVRKLLQRNRSAVLPFLPPEVHRGERFGRSADVYMFGILMWELYTGGVAFSNLAGTPIKLLQTIIADGVRPPWPEGTPTWYQSLACRCWASNPRQRPSFRRISDKLAETSAAAAMATAAAAAGWAAGAGGTLQ